MYMVKGIKQHDDLMDQLFWHLMLVTAVAIVTLMLSISTSGDLPVGFLGIECGIVGAIASLGINLYSMEDKRMGLFANSPKAFSMLILSGGLLALLVYILYAANGDSLPMEYPHEELRNAKIILLCFASGFVAKFIPDLIALLKPTVLGKKYS